MDKYKWKVTVDTLSNEQARILTINHHMVSGYMYGYVADEVVEEHNKIVEELISKIEDLQCELLDSQERFCHD